MKEIINYLDTLFPNPKCELNYNKDYELLIATMLSAQTTDKRVNTVTDILFNKYNSLDKLRNADVNDIKDIIKPIGTYNKKSLNIINIAKELKKYGDVVPNNREILESLSGVGRKTANVVLSILYHENFIAVDTHVNRVTKRLGISKENDDLLTVELKLNEFFKGQDLSRLHHQLVLFGRYYCQAKNPKCQNCNLKNICKKSD